VEAVAAIAHALTPLHPGGGAHRGIKPTKLSLHDDAWGVGDFGVVGFPGKEEITRTGEQVGAAYYIGPEMVSAAKTADSMKADVYSLGKTLWVLATGQTQPLPGEQPKDRAQTAIRTFAPHPKAHLLDELVDRAVRTNHEERPAMSAFAA